jgi:hypothetical protein
MFVSAAPSSYSAAVQLSHKGSRFQAPDTAADIIIAYRDLELHSMFCPILLPPYGQLQPMLKTIHLLCITVSVGRSRSVKNAADTKLFASPGLAKSKYRRFSRPTSTAMHKRGPRIRWAVTGVLLPGYRSDGIL